GGPRGAGRGAAGGGGARRGSGGGARRGSGGGARRGSGGGARRGRGRGRVGQDGPVRVLVAPDSFGGTLTAVQAAEAIAEGWHRGAPHDDVARLPLSDGGPGFVDILHAAASGRGAEDVALVPRTVTGPLGDPVPAVLLRTASDAGVTVYAEAAHAVGLHLVPPDRRDPTRTTSAGVGELLRAA